MVKDHNTALAYESSINNILKSPSPNDSVNVKWETIKEIRRFPKNHV